MTMSARGDRPYIMKQRTLGRCASLALMCIAACESDGEPTTGPIVTSHDAGGTMDGGVGGSLLDARVDAALDGSAQHIETDAANPPSHDAAAELLGHRLDQLAQSQRAWDALASASPGSYWYEEENCVANIAGGGGNSSVVQIEADGGHVVERRSFSRNECQAAVNRYGDLFSATGQASPLFGELYALCAKQLMERPDSTLSFDARGVVKDCWVGDAPRCNDACGSGFSLRQWGFGSAPHVGDGGVVGDAGR